MVATIREEVTQQAGVERGMSGGSRGRTVEVECKECGKHFLAFMSWNRQYCSNKCRQIAVGKMLKGRVYNPLRRENNIKRATKWNKDHPKRRREIIDNYSHKHMDKIVAWSRNHPKERNITIQKNQKKMRQKVIDLLGYHCAQIGRAHV